MPYNDEAFALESQFPSQIENNADLVQNRLRVLKHDFQWRERYTDMKKYGRLYHESKKNQQEDEIPRVNKIQGAVDDHVSVAMQNVPDVEMKASREITRFTNPLKQAIFQKSVDEAEQTVNAMIREIKEENRFRQKIERAGQHAGIYGVGYIKTEIDNTMDTRQKPELRRLLQKDMSEWSKRDAKIYRAYSQRINIEAPDPRDVVFEHGHRAYDPDKILRVSEVERASVRHLRSKYQNEDIRPGMFPFYIEEDPESDGDITAVATTWEIEPVYVEKTVERGGTEVTSKFTAWQMVKTKIAGGQLVEKEISDPMESRARLPIVPLYLRESEQHPYGEALPEKLEQSEEFINLMRLILYKSAKNAASNQAAVVDASKLTSSDKDRLENVMDQGGLAALDGIPQSKGLDQIVQPLNMNSSLSSAPIEAMQNEERTFKEESNALDMQALNQAESGAAKRTQIMASDRSKNHMFSNLARAKLSIYDNIFEIMQLKYGNDEMPAMARDPEGRRNEVRVNQSVQDKVPKINQKNQLITRRSNRDAQDPIGVVLESFEYDLNDLTLPMTAQPKHDLDLPGSPTNRFNLLLMYLQTGMITKETMRELQLSDKIMAMDNAKRADQKRQKRLQQKRQKMQQASQAAAMEGDPQMSQRIQQQMPAEDMPASPEQGRDVPRQRNSSTPEPDSQSGQGIPALQNLQGGQGPGGNPEGPTPSEQSQEQDISR